MAEIVKVKRVEKWYADLVDDLKRLAFEGIVCTKHAIGKRILEDELKFNKPKYGSKRIENLAKDMDVSKDDLWACMRFAKKYKNLDGVQQFSWRYIWHKLLPAPKPDKVETPPLPAGKFNLIYADPPWEYRNVGVEGAVSEQYATMSIEQICQLPIKRVIPENAVLFLWTTNPILEESLPVITAWGFEYKTNFCWFKTNRKTGIGFYVRGVHELLLVCIKGSMLPKYTPLSVLKFDAGKHSEKPKDLYKLIERMYPDCHYLEMFARHIEKKKRRPNWTYWGAEVEIKV